MGDVVRVELRWRGGRRDGQDGRRRDRSGRGFEQFRKWKSRMGRRREALCRLIQGLKLYVPKTRCRCLRNDFRRALRRDGGSAASWNLGRFGRSRRFGLPLGSELLLTEAVLSKSILSSTSLQQLSSRDLRVSSFGHRSYCGRCVQSRGKLRRVLLKGSLRVISLLACELRLYVTTESNRAEEIGPLFSCRRDCCSSISIYVIG